MMRALGLYLFAVARREAVGTRAPVPEPEEVGPAWTEERATAWRRWRLEGVQLEASARARRAARLRVSSPHRAGPWLPLILDAGRLGG